MAYLPAYVEQQTLNRVPGPLLNNHRFAHPPPSYPTSSNPTRSPPSTRLPQDLNDIRRMRIRVESRLRGTPSSLFQLQAQRERARLLHQRSALSSGRTETYPFDPRLSFVQNAENNIRTCWKEQGIWKSEWGPAWVPVSGDPLENGMLWKDETPHPEPRGEWAHEKGVEGVRQKIASTEGPSRTSVVGGASSGEHRLQKQAQASSALSPSARDASRPYHQFLWQVSRERRWVQDELGWDSTSENVDLDDAAFNRVKEMWREDGLWLPHWDVVPGMIWPHEQPDDHVRYHSGAIITRTR